MKPNIQTIDVCISMNEAGQSCDGDLRTAHQCLKCFCFKPLSEQFIFDVSKRADEIQQKLDGMKT